MTIDPGSNPHTGSIFLKLIFIKILCNIIIQLFL